MTSQERRLARILDHHARSAERQKHYQRSPMHTSTIIDHDRERRRRLQMLKETNSNVYSSNNKSTSNANQTIKAIFEAITEKNKDHAEVARAEQHQANLFVKSKKPQKRDNPGKYAPLASYEAPSDAEVERRWALRETGMGHLRLEQESDSMIEEEKKEEMNDDVTEQSSSPVRLKEQPKERRLSFIKGRRNFYAEVPVTGTGLPIVFAGETKSSMKDIDEIEAIESPTVETKLISRTPNDPEKERSRKSQNDQQTGFTAFAATFTDMNKRIGTKRATDIKAVLPVNDNKMETDLQKSNWEYPLQTNAKLVQNVNTANDSTINLESPIIRNSAFLSKRTVPDNKLTSPTKNSPQGNTFQGGLASTKSSIQPAIDIEQLFQKYYSDRMTGVALQTMRELMNPRKDLQILKAFVSDTASKIKNENFECSKLVPLLEDLEKFTLSQFSRLLKAEMKDYEDIFQVLDSLRTIISAGKAHQQKQKMDKLKEKIISLEKELAEKKEENAEEIKNSTVSQLQATPDEGIEEATKKTTTLMKNIENLKEEIDTINKSNIVKERKHITAMSKLQEKLKFVKTMNNTLVDKYNQQCDRMNKLKQRILYYVRKMDPSAEAGDPEQIINMEIHKAMEDDEPSIERPTSVTSEKEEEPTGVEAANNVPGSGNGTGFMVVDTIDTFDYYQYYDKRNVIRKSHSQRRNPNVYYKDSQHFKYYKEIVALKDMKQDTKGLVLVNEVSSQSIVSFVDPKYDNIIENQYELDSYRKRVEFERSVLERLTDKRHMCFITDRLVRSLIGLEEIRPKPDNPSQAMVEIDQSELVDNVREHQVKYHFEDEATFNDELKREIKDSYFRLDLIDEYIKHTVKVPLPVSESMVKYLFLSYIFSIQTLKQKTSLIERRESQVEVLFRICQTYKNKIKDYDRLIKKLNSDLQNFTVIHRGCGVNHLTAGFKYNEKQNIRSDMDVVDNKSTLTFKMLIHRIKKMKMIMKMINKKFFSFKIAYQKLHLFFQLRSSEVEYIEGPSIKHNLPVEEHFFRFLTEKDNGIKKIEAKIKNFIITIYNMDPNPKIEIFKSFANLSTTMPYGRIEEYFYLKAIDYIRQESRGLEIQPDYHLGLNYVPYEKLESFVLKYVVPRISPRSASILWKSLRDMINLNTDYVAKKGVIDFDSAMQNILKWINTKTTAKFDAEYCFFLFDMLDLEKSGTMTFKDFMYVYKLFNLDIYGESTRLISKMRSPAFTIKQSLTSQDFEDSMLIPAPESDNGNQKAWMDSNYIYSDLELREIYAKYTDQNFRETEDMPTKMELCHFTAMINDYENLFDLHRIYAFLNIKGDNVENDFYLALNDFLDSIDNYTNFVNECRIRDNQWKEGIRLRIKDFKAVFQNKQQLTEEMNQLISSLIQANIENVSEDKLMNHLMTKALLAYKIFLLDLMQADFEQRFDYAQAKALPF